jgi:hypothetical protein
MEYSTARAQPTPKPKPRNTPIKVGQKGLMLDGVYRARTGSGTPRDPFNSWDSLKTPGTPLIIRAWAMR